jgi:signal transduction histidine kinase
VALSLTLAELKLREEHIDVLGIQKPNGEYIGVPHGERQVEAGDVLVLYATEERLEEVDVRKRGRAGTRRTNARPRGTPRLPGSHGRLPGTTERRALNPRTFRARVRPRLGVTPLRVVTNRTVPFRPRLAAAWIAVACLLATVLIALGGGVRFAYNSVEVHVMIATAVALIGILAAGLVVARFLRSRQLQDLALALALVVLSASNLFMSALPAAFGELDSHFAAWGPFCGRLVGGLLFALSVAVPDRKVPNPRLAAWVTLVGGVALTGVLTGIVAVFAPDWGDPLVDRLGTMNSDSPHLTADTLQLVLIAVTFALYVVATLGFVRRAEETGDELFGWFALASPFGAASALNYFLFPSLYPGWVYTADIFRLGFYLMIAVGTAREIAAWQQQLVAAAATGERRRIARDLHDGLAQELAFIVGQTRSLVAKSGEEGPFSHIAAAAERALDESRTAIAALSRNVDDPLDVALAHAAEDVAARTGAHIRFDLTPGIHVAPEVREDLARIVREAVSNAARHGEASNVTVALSNTDGIRVSVTDDGKGFDPAAPRRRGFGLTSMRERAEMRGATVEVRSSPGEGTEVEVVLR